MTEELEPAGNGQPSTPDSDVNPGAPSAPHPKAASDPKRRLSIADVSLLATATLVVASTAYEWFYFRVLGPDLISYVSAADLPSLLVAWLPGVALAWLIYYCVVELPTVGVERGMTEDEIISKSPNPRLTSKLRRSPYVVLPYLAVSTAVLHMVFVPNGSYLLLAFAIFAVWLPLSARILALPRLQRRYGQSARRLIMFLPAVMCYVGGWGASEAQRDLAEDQGKYSIVLTTNGAEIRDSVLLRSLTVGVLIRIPSNSRIEFVPWSAIDRLYRESMPIPPESRACRWWGVLCDPEARSGTPQGQPALVPSAVVPDDRTGRQGPFPDREEE